jgi:hypothetical protein
VEFFNVGLQFIDELLLIYFGGTDVPVTGQVLDLPKIMHLHPMGDHRCPYLIEIFYRMIDLSQVLQDDPRDPVNVKRCAVNVPVKRYI